MSSVRPSGDTGVVLNNAHFVMVEASSMDFTRACNFYIRKELHLLGYSCYLFGLRMSFQFYKLESCLI